MCSKTVGVFDCKPANVANDIGVVVVDAIAAADGKFAGKIVALLDWIADIERKPFVVEFIFSRLFFRNFKNGLKIGCCCRVLTKKIESTRNNLLI